jgi:hypothetical protein
MHIKWKTHHIHEYEYKEAVIVQSVRVDGKPRHRTIVRLGSFTPSDLNTNIADRVRNEFWGRADIILACNESAPAHRRNTPATSYTPHGARVTTTPAAC